MRLFEIILTALALAMDAFAVSAATGMLATNLRKRDAIKTGIFCGVFQFIMPLIGWFLGSTVRSYIESFDHWIAFALLGFIGGRMVYSYFKGEKDEAAKISDAELFGNKRLLLLAVATSIDALAVGISFAILSVNIWSACTIIGIIAFILSLVGVLLGKKLGPVLKDKAELIGGVVLILIGAKILFEHIIK